MKITEEQYNEIASCIKTKPVSVPKDILEEFCFIYKIAKKHELHFFVPDPDNSNNVYICYDAKMNESLYMKFSEKYRSIINQGQVYYDASMKAFENIYPQAKKLNRDNPTASILTQYEELFGFKVGKW